MRIDIREKELIRDLAKRVKEISLEPVQQEYIRMWKDKNSLKK